MQELTDESARGAPNEPDAGVDPFTGEELLVAVRRASVRVIGPKLREAGLSRWVDDVAGEVVVSAWKARASFDPELGVLQGWVNRIAQRRAADRIEAEAKRNGDLLGESADGEGYSIEEQLARAGDRAARGQVDDIAVTVAKKLAIDAWLGPIMAATSGVMDPVAFVHGFLTHVGFDSDVKAAATAFGISEARVREHKRSLELHAQVILRAWQKRRELDGAPPRLRDLVECLPEPGVAGSWTRQMAEAVVSWPGQLADVPAEHVQEKTGWTFDTSRQYLAITRTLLRVALGVMSADDNGNDGEGTRR